MPLNHAQMGILRDPWDLDMKSLPEPWGSRCTVELLPDHYGRATILCARGYLPDGSAWGIQETISDREIALSGGGQRGYIDLVMRLFHAVDREALRNPEMKFSSPEPPQPRTQVIPPRSEAFAEEPRYAGRYIQPEPPKPKFTTGALQDHPVQMFKIEHKPEVYDPGWDVTHHSTAEWYWPKYLTAILVAGVFAITVFYVTFFASWYIDG